MLVPVQITYRNVQKRDSVDALIHELCDKLDRVCDHVDSCRVAIEHPHSVHRNGQDYRVRIDLTVAPSHEIVVSRESTEPTSPEVLESLLRDAFDAAKRRVLKLAEQQREEVKRHFEQEVHGMVSRLMEDYGFIQTPEGREIYFHKNSVLSPGFEAMRIGQGVTFAEEPGDEGPQASTVRILDRRGERIAHA
jgi:cold shock CspA family protein